MDWGRGSGFRIRGVSGVDIVSAIGGGNGRKIDIRFILGFLLSKTMVEL